MRHFSSALAERQTDPAGRKWLFVPYDQLSDRIGPLARAEPHDIGIILVENPWKAARRPYHRQKLALVLANMRHFALEQAGRGVAVQHIVHKGPYRDALASVVEAHGPLRMMRAAERELRSDLAPLLEDGRIEELPHEGWLTSSADFDAAQDGPPWRMDAFYRHVRRQSDILMEGDKPLGGKYSFDVDNRKGWRGDPPAPEPPRFDVDAIKQEVGDLIESRFASHPGSLDLEALPATLQDAGVLWAWAKTACLPRFGPYQDAMSQTSESLFHTRISALLHLHRLLPRRVVDDVVELDIPLQSREGFVRQVLGWREFVRHVHETTDGFAGTETNFFAAEEPLPEAYWRGDSGLHCLDRVVADVWRSGYGHHITRLMVLSNIATLLDVDPRQLTDWFWAAYADAYDWVVEPNVLGMGSYALGPVMTTKPYVSGAAYIDRMGDFCHECAFDPGKNCPLTRLYWAFLARHQEKLASNPRMRLPLASMRKRADEQQQLDRRKFESVKIELRRGKTLSPE